MRICTTTIMLNEPPEFITRWAGSARDSDDLVLIDTGSTNDAVECARDLGITVHEILVRPWRFDVARMTGLTLLPGEVDIVITLDVDEVLTSGWRDEFEQVTVEDGEPRRFSYNYIWNHLPDGQPDVHFRADRTYTRFGWQWKHPVHESLYPAIGSPTQPIDIIPLNFTIEHFADESKPRSQYLDLLKLAVQEDPGNDRMAHYYARELFGAGQWAAARQEFVRHLSLPTAIWPAERAQTCRFLAKMDTYPERWMQHAVAEAPRRREPLVDLVDYWLKHDEPIIAAGYARQALRINDPADDYLREATSWSAEGEQRLRRIIAAASNGGESTAPATIDTVEELAT